MQELSKTRHIGPHLTTNEQVILVEFSISIFSAIFPFLNSDIMLVYEITGNRILDAYLLQHNIRLPHNFSKFVLLQSLFNK